MLHLKKLRKAFEEDLTSDAVAKYLRRCMCFDVLNTVVIYYSTKKIATEHLSTVKLGGGK